MRGSTVISSEHMLKTLWSPVVLVMRTIVVSPERVGSTRST